MEGKAREIVYCLGFRYFHGLDDVTLDASSDCIISNQLNSGVDGTHGALKNRQDLLTGGRKPSEVNVRRPIPGHDNDDAREKSFTSFVSTTARRNNCNQVGVEKCEQFRTSSLCTDDVGMIASGHRSATEEESIAMDEINLWHLRALAIQRGGLMNSSLRKLCWTKLGGLDELVFLGNLDIQSLQRSHRLESNEEYLESCQTYHDIQSEMEQFMPPSGWHIQSERRRLKVQSMNKSTKTKQHQDGNQHVYRDGLSHVPRFPHSNNSFLPSFSPQSTSTYSSYSSNDLSSIGSDTENSGSTTPLTANTSSTINTANSFQTANSGWTSNGQNASRFAFSPTLKNYRLQGGMSGTPKSVSFSPYTEIFAGNETGNTSSHTTATPKGNPANVTAVATGSQILSSLTSPNAPSPLSITSPSHELESGSAPDDFVLPQCQDKQIQPSTQSSPRKTHERRYPYPQSYLQYTQSSHTNRGEQTQETDQLQQQQQQQGDEQKSTPEQGLKKKRKKKKDRRMQERNAYLLGIATSAFYMANRDMSDRDGRWESIATNFAYFSGVQDLIAVFLLHLESPSLSTLLLKQVLRSHLKIFASVKSEDDFYDGCEDISLKDMASASISSSVVERSCESNPGEIKRSSDAGSVPRKSDNWNDQQTHGFDFLSLSFLPLLKVLDEELYDSLMSSNDTTISDTNSAVEDTTERILSLAMRFGKLLQKWMSSWFCCNHSLPIEAVSRIVDFLMASHPFMPLYLSIAFLSGPTKTNRLVLLSPEKLERQDFDIMQDLLNPSQYCADDCPHRCIMDKVMEYVECSISMSIVFIKRTPPSTVYQLLQKYYDGILLQLIAKNAFIPSPTSSIVLPSSSIQATVPTDYRLIERSNCGTGRCHSGNAHNIQSIICNYQIALDAQGVDQNRVTKTNSVQNRRKVKGLRVLLLVVALILAIESQAVVSYVAHYLKPFQALPTVKELDSGLAGQSVEAPSQEHKTNTILLFDVPNSKSKPVQAQCTCQVFDNVSAINESNEGTRSIVINRNEISESSAISSSPSVTEENGDVASLEDEDKELKMALLEGRPDSVQHVSKDTSVRGTVARIVVPDPQGDCVGPDLITQYMPPEQQQRDSKSNAALKMRQGLQKHIRFLKTEYLAFIDELGVIE